MHSKGIIFLTVVFFGFVRSQFIDHVFVHVDVDKKDRMDIPVPNGDTTFGSKPLTFSRSKRISHGFRKNLIENALSSYVDASNVYGHTFERAKRLRLFKDGLLKTKDNALDNAYLPYNDVKLPNAPNPNLTRLFLGGDVRANEQPNLLVLHTIWLREHNLIALELKKNVGSHWDDEKLYQSARSIVIAEMQKVTYDEMIPAFLGGFKDIALGKYEGWKWWVNPTVSNFFTTGSFRLGHSMVNDNLTVLSEGNTRRRRIDMRNHFWNPKIVTELGVEPFLRGMAKTNTQECDIEMSPSLRNFLFNKVPEAAGVDLAAINIQRGREHGTPDYNSMRRHFGLRPRRSFSEITKDQRVARMLKRAYNGDINNVDPWVAGLAEDHVGGGSMGELFRASWIDEFRRMRDGDRLWYQQYDRVFTKELQEKSQHVKDVMNDNLTMKDIVVRNSNVARNDLQDNLFIVS